MVDEKKIKEAKVVFDSFKRFLDSKNWNYTVVDEKPEEIYTFKFTVRGDDLPMDFIVMIQVDRGIIKFVSPQPVKFDNEKLSEAALALCKINDDIADGAYSLDIKKGMVLFNMTTCFRGSLLSDEVFSYLLGMSGAIVDNYNDKLLMLQKGLIDLETFLEKC